MITVVMYHYIRPINESRYPGIKGLELQSFKRQLNFLKKNYTFITVEELNAYYTQSHKLPENAVLLTFDDGYSDHYSYVFPLLQSLNIQGSFFVPVKPIVEKMVLDVNKIHLLLATVEINRLIISVKKMLKHYRQEPNILDFETYYNELAKANRFDAAEVIFLKRLLQHKLPVQIRQEIINSMFDEFIDISESVISEELYLNIDQIKLMHRNGMHIGAHTYNHYWLNKISRQEQEEEISNNIDFLENLNSSTNKGAKTFSYPFGGYNDCTIDLMNKYDFDLGFTTNVDTVKNQNYSKFEIPRMDTNDFPQ